MHLADGSEGPVWEVIASGVYEGDLLLLMTFLGRGGLRSGRTVTILGNGLQEMADISLTWTRRGYRQPLQLRTDY